MSYFFPELSARIVRTLSLFVLVFAICVGANGQTLAFNPGLASTVAGGGTDTSPAYAGSPTTAKLGAPERVAFDGNGDLYFVEASSKLVRVLASGRGAIGILPGVQNPVAGDIYTVPGTNFYEPSGLAVDSYGNVFIADRADNVIKVIYAGGKVINLPEHAIAGNVYTVAGLAGISGSSGDGVPALGAQLNQPTGVSVDANGNVYLADTANGLVRIIYSSGTVPGVPNGALAGDVYTIAGSSQVPCAAESNRIAGCGDFGPARLSELNAPTSVSLDANGNIYLSDAGDSRVRVIYIAGSLPGISAPVVGDIYTIAGVGVAGEGADGLQATTAQLSQQIGQVAFDAAGSIYIPDTGNNVIRKVDIFGTITTVFGGSAPVCSSAANIYGDGCSTNLALLDTPTATAVDAQGNLYIADSGHNLIRKATVSTSALSFSGSIGSSSSESLSISNTSPKSLQLSRIDVEGAFPEISGNGSTSDCANSTTLETGRSCQITIGFSPTVETTSTGSITLSSNATNGVESTNQVTLTGTGTALMAGVHALSRATATPEARTSLSGVHPEAMGSTPVAVVPGMPTTPGFINTVAGSNANGPGFALGYIGTPALQAGLDTVTGVALDSAGNVYFTDTQQDFGTGGGVFQVDTAAGNLNLIAGGGGGSDFPTNGDSPLNTLFADPSSVALDSSNNVYVSDNGIIAKVNADGSVINVVVGIVGAYTGDPLGHVSGDNGPATSATLGQPSSGVFIDSTGTMYIADTGNSAIRKVDSTGIITTVAGKIGVVCSSATCGDGSAATSAQLNEPSAVFVDSNSNIYIADSKDFRVRIVYESGAATACLIALENPSSFSLGGATSCAGATPPVPTPAPSVGAIYTIAGNSVSCPTSSSDCGNGGLATSAGFVLLSGLTVDRAGNIFISDSSLSVVRRVDSQTGLISTIAGSIRTHAYGGDGGAATSALLNGPQGLALDAAGNLYIGDPQNYVLRAIAGAGSLPQIPQTITFNPLSGVTYGAAPISLSATVDSGLPITYTVTGPATISGSTLTITGVGTVTVTATQPGDSTHAPATPVSQGFNVAQAVITVTASDLSLPFGTSLPAPLPFTVSPLVGSDTTVGSPNLTTSYLETTPVGTTLPINIAQGSLAVSPASSAANYTFALVPGTLTVTGGGSQTITFPALPSSIAYGSKPIPLSATASSGLPVSYTATGSAIVTGSVSSGWTLTVVGAGPGSVTATQAGNSQFGAATPAVQAFSVKQAPLTVTATDISQQFGTPLPSPLPFTVSGLVGSDSTSGSPQLTTAYTPTSAVGQTFPISVAQGTLAIQPPGLNGNYIFTPVSGTLTVTGGANTITFSAIANKVYGSSFSLTGKASSGLPVSYAVSGPATLSGSTVTVVGVGLVTVTATQAGNSNIAPATPVTQSFTATPAVLLVTATSLTRAFGAENPLFTYQIGGFVNGDANGANVLTGTPLITTPATPASPAGAYPIVPSLGTLASTNYTFAFTNGSLTVTGAPSYIITANPSSLTVQLGQSVQTTLQLTPVNNYQGSVALSCGQVPIGVTCTFSPATLSLALVGNNISTQSVLGTLTVVTTSQASRLRPLFSGRGGNIATAAVFFIPGGLTGLLLAFNRRRLATNGRLRRVLLLLVMFIGAVGLGACGGGSNPNVAQPGTTSLLITATGSGTAGTGSPNTTNFLSLTVNITQ